jgi:hypothetical protein
MSSSQLSPLIFDHCAKTKDEILPNNIILIVHILPIPDGVVEDCGLGNKMRFGELDILRNHDQGGHVVLGAKTTDTFQCCLSRKGVCINIIFSNVRGGEHTANFASRQPRSSGQEI